MSQTNILYRICPQCNGDGVFQPAHGPGNSQISCTWPGCNGTGYIELSKIVADPGNEDILNVCDSIVDKCNDIHEKCNDIFEKCNDILEQLSS